MIIKEPKSLEMTPLGLIKICEAVDMKKLAFVYFFKKYVNSRREER